MSTWVETLLTTAPVAAFVSAGMTLWLRSKDRPQAHWIGESLNFQLPDEPSSMLFQALKNDPPCAALIVSNAGDADAYALRIEGVGCEPFFLIQDDRDPRGGWIEKALVRGAVGAELRIVIRPLPEVAFSKENAIVRLIWVRSPVRHRKYEAQEFDVSRPDRPPLPQPWYPPFQG